MKQFIDRKYINKLKAQKYVYKCTFTNYIQLLVYEYNALIILRYLLLPSNI